MCVELADCPTLSPKPSAACLRPLGRLPSLAPTALVPSCVSPRSQALAELATVESVRVRARGDVFVVELFSKPAPRSERRIPLPLAASSRVGASLPSSPRSTGSASPRASIKMASPSDPTAPTVAVEKRLADFSDLRNQMYLGIMAAHVRQPFCAYCRELLNHSIWGYRVPSGLGARLLGMRDREDSRTVALLTQFATELLERTLATDAHTSTCHCSSQTDVPVMVRDFFFGQ